VAAGAAGKAQLVPSQTTSFDDMDRDRELLRRKKDIRFTSERLGFARGFVVPSAAVGARGGSGQAPPFLPHGLTFFWRLEPLRLIWPMHDTLGDDGSGVRYPDRGLLFLLLPPPRASGGTMETMGPEKALRWLKEDLPRFDGKVEEKDATVERKKEASPAAPVKLLDLAWCFLCFFVSIRNASISLFARAVARFFAWIAMPFFASGSVFSLVVMVVVVVVVVASPCRSREEVLIYGHTARDLAKVW
jgi:hypothetical protein